jgi:hypothetical protein
MSGYLDACKVLDSRLCQTLGSDRLKLDYAFMDIDAALSVLDQAGSQIQQARRVLIMTRNKSAMLSPISVLPSETPLYIFALVKPPCPIDHKSCSDSSPLVPLADPLSFSRLLHVSKCWYGLLVHDPSLWSHRRNYWRGEFSRSGVAD